jgi:CheY-like chemotaxis protein
MAEIGVRDTGIGIDPALLPILFEPFTQGEQTLARTEGGVGLGLALVKGIVEMHGGTVHAESGGPNKGALFTIRLPVVSAGTASTARAAPAPAEASTRRVLVVDDNRDAADSLAALVQVFGHEADTAYDGPGAIDKAQSFVPDVVLCDLGLPGMSGYEVARALRAQREAVRLIAVSGYAMPDDIARAIEAGFDSHVTKPAQPEALRRLLA